MRFSEIVCELRAKKSLSREKLAEKVGVSPDVIAAWEEGTQYPDQEHLLLLARAFKVRISDLVNEDRELMLKVIDGTETEETVIMAGLSVLLVICAGALVGIQHVDADLVGTASRVTEVLLLEGFAALAFMRRTPNARREAVFRDAIEAAEGSEQGLLKVTAGRNTRLVIAQFVLGAIIALTLIVLLGVLMPESQLPWVML